MVDLSPRVLLALCSQVCSRLRAYYILRLRSGNVFLCTDVYFCFRSRLTIKFLAGSSFTVVATLILQP